MLYFQNEKHKKQEEGEREFDWQCKSEENESLEKWVSQQNWISSIISSS